MAEQALTPLCRAAWTQNVFTPRVETKTDKKTGQVREVSKWSCQLVFDPSASEGLQELMNAAFRVGQEAFGENFWAMVQQGSIRWPFRNGAEINPKTGQPRYEQGVTFINVSSGQPIDVVSRYCDPADPQRKPIKVTDPSQLWPGQYVKASVTFKEYREPSWGVGCYVNGLQLFHEGERWGDSFDAQQAFNAEGEAPAGQFGPGSSQQSAPPAPGTTPSTNGPGPGAAPPQPSTAPGVPPGAPTGPQSGTQPGPSASGPAAPAQPPAPGAATSLGQPGPAQPGPTAGPPSNGGGGSSLL